MATIAAENFTQPTTFHGEAQGEGMDWAISTQVLLTCIAGFLVWHVLKYSRIKGPIVWPVVGTTPQFLWNLPRMHDWTTDMLVKHDGTYTSIAPKCTCLTAVATCRPENLEYVLKTNFANYPKGRSFTYPSHDLLGQGIFNTDHDLWKMQRKTASLEFSTRTLRDLMVKSNRSSVQQRLLPTLAEVANSREPIDFQDLFLRYTFDNICIVGFGVDPGCLAPGLPTVPFAQAFDLATEGTLTRMVVPEIFWRATRYFGVGMEGRLAKAIGVIDKFAMNVITERRKELALLKRENATDYPCDLLSRFMQSTDHAGLPYTDAFLRDVTTNFILAGRDTTAIALSWFFYLITQHPEVELKILEEINQIVQNRAPNPDPHGSEKTTKNADATTKTAPSVTKTAVAAKKGSEETEKEEAKEEERGTKDDRETGGENRATESDARETEVTEEDSSTMKVSPTIKSSMSTDNADGATEKAFPTTENPDAELRSLGFEELKQLHYLHAALSESMRLYPSVPIDNKDVTADDFLPDGTFVRKGTRLMYSIYSMGRMESVWGKDCLQFRPERWLRNGVFTPESPFRYTVFNAGPRLCLGKELAYLQMKSVASAILRNYHVRLVEGHKIEYKLSLTLFMKYGLRVTLHPRMNADC